MLSSLISLIAIHDLLFDKPYMNKKRRVLSAKRSSSSMFEFESISTFLEALFLWQSSLWVESVSVVGPSRLRKHSLLNYLLNQTSFLDSSTDMGPAATNPECKTYIHVRLLATIIICHDKSSCSVLMQVQYPMVFDNQNN